MKRVTVLVFPSVFHPLWLCDDFQTKPFNDVHLDYLNKAVEVGLLAKQTEDLDAGRVVGVLGKRVRLVMRPPPPV